MNTITQSELKTEPATQRAGIAALLILLLGLLAAGLVLYPTTQGLGVTPDSVVYLDAARNLAQGRGYSSEVFGPLRPVADWPPLYSSILALTSAVTSDIYSAARWLQAAMMGCLVSLTGWLLYRYGRAGLSLSIAGAIAILLSHDILQIHARLLSEPLFMCLILASIMLILYYLEKPGLARLVVAGATVSLLPFTRYYGVPLAAASVLVIGLYSKGKSWQRFANTAAFAAAAFLPLVCFGIRNMHLLGHPMIGGVAWQYRGFHPKEFLQAAKVLGFWCVPQDWWPPASYIEAKLVMVAFWLTAAIIVARSLVLPLKQWGDPRYRAVIVAIILFSSYLSFYVFTRLFEVSEDTRSLCLDDPWRYLPPIRPLVVFAVIVSLRNVYEKVNWHKWSAFWLVGIAALMGFESLITTTSWVACVQEWPAGYVSRQWKDSETIAFVNQLQERVPIFSDHPAFIHFRTKRVIKLLPALSERSSTGLTVRGSHDMQYMQDACSKQGGMVILFTNDVKDYYLSAYSLTNRYGFWVYSNTADAIILKCGK